MENEFIYRYYSKPWRNNRVTIVGKLEEGLLKIAASRCSKSDNFCKKTGRELAEKRLKEGKFIAIFPIDKCSIKTFIGLVDGLEDAIRWDPRLLKK